MLKPTNQTIQLLPTFTDGLFKKEPLPEYMVKGMIPLTGIACIYGPSGSGKTFLTLELARCVSQGIPFFGHKCKQRPATYVCFEGAGGITLRSRALSMRHGETPIRYINATDNMNLTNDADCNRLVFTLEHLAAKGGLVCIDTLAASTVGLDENSAKEMGQIMSKLKYIQTRVGGVVLVIHHTGKNEDNGARGSSSLGQALDSTIMVRRDRPANKRSFYIEKVKDGEDGGVQRFELQKIALGIDSDGDEISSCVVSQPTLATIQKPNSLQILINSQTDDYVFDWIVKQNDAGHKTSKNFLQGQREEMQMDFLPDKQKYLTQVALRDSINRLIGVGKIAESGSGPKSALEPVLDTVDGDGDGENESEENTLFKEPE